MEGHVGFFLRADGENVYLLGGNQLDEVREHSYPLATVLAYRWPSGFARADYRQRYAAFVETRCVDLPRKPLSKREWIDALVEPLLLPCLALFGMLNAFLAIPVYLWLVRERLAIPR